MHILFQYGHSLNPTNQAISKEMTTSHAWPNQKPRCWSDLIANEDNVNVQLTPVFRLVFRQKRVKKQSRSTSSYSDAKWNVGCSKCLLQTRVWM